MLTFTFIRWQIKIGFKISEQKYNFAKILPAYRKGKVLNHISKLLYAYLNSYLKKNL